ncbi:cation:proton antiporter regulatory subunit [Haloarchaeobius litoreus]|uniref:Cation:proton antiporter regulatory subunit n=1 Tax=Haloarchaeobius litoreus TaxID=755306 RepID=A0ABD6DLY4_9EURY|nr:TrkA C-terminal domain-containing protein [Haloarchaeobius litoreus]
MTVYETDVPGVGRKFELEVGEGARLVVLMHHDGRRELFHRPNPDADSQRIVDLDGETARQLGAILTGAYFQPIELDRTQVPLGEAILEWVEIGEGSSIVGQTLSGCDVRNQTGVSVIAIQRGDETVPNPDPDETIAADDILVVLGTREEQQALQEFVDQ